MSEPKRKASEAYLAKLKDPRWQKKRLEIMGRDKFRCRFCLSDDKTLTVHHKAYVWGRDPWDYNDTYLITICQDCHENEHAKRKGYEEKLLLNLKLCGYDARLVDILACALTNEPVKASPPAFFLGLHEMACDPDLAKIITTIGHAFANNNLPEMKRRASIFVAGKSARAKRKNGQTA